MFTGAVLLIPLYRVMRTLNLLNTYWAMIIPGVAFLIPTGIWLLRGYLEKIPRELKRRPPTSIAPPASLYFAQGSCCRWRCRG